MKYSALYTNVLLKILPPKDDSIATLVSSTDTDIKYAVVISAGHQTEKIDNGDICLFYIRDAKRIELEGNFYYLIPERDILLVQENV